MTVRYSREDLLRVIYVLGDELSGNGIETVEIVALTPVPRVSNAKLRAIAEDAVAEVER